MREVAAMTAKQPGSASRHSSGLCQVQCIQKSAETLQLMHALQLWSDLLTNIALGGVIAEKIGSDPWFML